jgi:hypothetical protein
MVYCVVVPLLLKVIAATKLNSTQPGNSPKQPQQNKWNLALVLLLIVLANFFLLFVYTYTPRAIKSI